ncbi:uncharacterized protein LOC126797279 [Argentina anserina]|uniref:uncharacterized protein LOC126797279 n=1 Tax=Argentina anserina TaxID=57926 RepID=UPI0021764028|nr:uncharacterized protein LOC126797279 [Potentilla anserina]
MENSKEQASWNENLVEVFVDLCIKEKTKEYARFRKKGISPELDQLFLGTTATGKHAWAPSSTLPIPDSPKEGDNDNYHEGSGDSNERDVSTNTFPKRKRSERSLKYKEKLPAKKEKVGGAVQLAKEIGRMCSAIESRSTASSTVHNVRTSIVEVMKDVTTLPGAE